MSDVRPPYDPELEPALRAFQRAAGLPVSITPEHIGTYRSLLEHVVFDAAAFPGVDVEDHVIAGPSGAPAIDIVLLRPKGIARSQPLPGLLYLHGGGMIAGNRFVGLDQVAEWIEAVPMVAASVEYRLAPEHTHPAPVEDCCAGLEWMQHNAGALGIDDTRLAVAGTSAGAGLAAAVALMARDHRGPRLVAQLLTSPMLDDRALTPSSMQFEREGTWDRISNSTGWTALLGDAAHEPDVSPYAAPARAGSLADLPAAYIDAGSAEIFRDEAVEYASRIWQAGGGAELHIWPGGFHGFESLAPTAALSRRARDAKVDWLRRTLPT